MNRRDFYISGGDSGILWDGICVVCGHDYINDCRGDCTCLSCNGQRQWEESEGLEFNEEDD